MQSTGESRTTSELHTKAAELGIEPTTSLLTPFLLFFSSKMIFEIIQTKLASNCGEEIQPKPHIIICKREYSSTSDGSIYLFLSLRREISWLCCRMSFSNWLVKSEYSSSWISMRLVWFSTYAVEMTQSQYVHSGTWA